MADQNGAEHQMPELVPCLNVRDPRASIAWFEKLGFRTVYAMPLPDGSIGHAHLARKGAELMLGSCPTTEPGASGMQLYITLGDESVDELCAHARRAGIEIGQDLQDQFWGDRTFEVVHPDGYHFIFAQHVRDVSMEEMQEAMNQWAAAGAPA